eukprot:COSAG02_NODE_53726_length_300_cov_0.671642_1_plen_40_part_10
MSASTVTNIRGYMEQARKYIIQCHLPGRETQSQTPARAHR